MTQQNLLPLGSIVILKGSTKKVMIISRALGVGVNGKPYYFDYGACFYPEGLVGDQLLYFNHEDIMRIEHEGFVSDEETIMQENIQLFVAQSGLTKGNTAELMQQKEEG